MIRRAFFPADIKSGWAPMRLCDGLTKTGSGMSTKLLGQLHHSALVTPLQRCNQSEQASRQLECPRDWSTKTGLSCSADGIQGTRGGHNSRLQARCGYPLIICIHIGEPATSPQIAPARAPPDSLEADFDQTYLNESEAAERVPEFEFVGSKALRFPTD